MSASFAHLRKPRANARHAARLGFIALNDCAPLVVAKELGFFAKHGARVILQREVGWATIREKIFFGELEGAHAPAGMVFAATSGLGSSAEECLTALVLNLHGNAIVLSRRLHNAGVQDGPTLRQHIRRSGKIPTLGVVYQWSSHHVLLRSWLRDHGMEPGKDVNIVVVPPSQVLANLKAGHLDGFCVGEPWASLTVNEKRGFVVARSAELAPWHPEKVFMVHRSYADRSPEEHLAIVAALLEACAYCDVPENQDEIVALLARPEYVGAPEAALRGAMGRHYDFGLGRIEECLGANIFARGDANTPTPEKANWVLDGFVRAGLLSAFPASLAERCFRMDLHAQARALVTKSLTTT